MQDVGDHLTTFDNNSTPFRTDDWPLFDPNDPAVRVEKPEKTDEVRGVKRNFKDWERPRMTQ